MDIKILLECFLKSLRINKLRLFLIVIYLYINYTITSILINEERILYLVLFLLSNTIHQKVLALLTLTIRLSAINFFRQRYICDILQQSPPEYSGIEYGTYFTFIKRMPNLITGIERDFIIFISSFPIVLKTIYNMSLYLILFNVFGIFLLYQAVRLRREGFAAEDKLGKNILEAFNAHSIIHKDNSAVSSIINSLNYENYQYTKAISAKLFISIGLHIGNAFIGYFLYKNNVKMVKTATIFGINITRCICSSVSIISTSLGLKYSLKKKINKKYFPNVVIKDVVIGYKNPILSIPKFEVSEGAKVCIYGPNGCGKTLFCRMLAGYERYSGTININPNSILITDAPIARFDKYCSKGETVLENLISAIEKFELVIIDEALDCLSGELLSSAIDMISSSTKTFVITSHNQFIINLFCAYKIENHTLES